MCWQPGSACRSLCCCGAAVALSLRGNLLPPSLCLAWVAGPAATLPSTFSACGVLQPLTGLSSQHFIARSPPSPASRPAAVLGVCGNSSDALGGRGVATYVSIGRAGPVVAAALARPLTLAQPLLVHPLVVKGLAAGNVALQWRWMPWALPVSTAPCRVALAVMPPAHGAGRTTSPCAPTLTPTWPARCKGRFPLSGFRPSVGSAGLSVSCRHGIHPTCRPAARAAAATDAPRTGSVDDLPTFDAIQAGGVRTLRHVPAAARSLWGRALSHALASVAHHNDERAWREFLMLPQCVLCPPPRGGRRHHKAAAAYTQDRLQRWLEGDRRALWEDRHQAPQSALRKRSAAQQRELAVALTREGFDRKACNALVQEGLCPETPDTAEALRVLHPEQPAVSVNASALPLAQEVSPDEVAKALRAFSVDTAPGPSGLRIQHLREARQPGETLALVEQLAAVVNLLARGLAHPSAAPVLAGASLVAVPKPKGGIRPIAIGEVLA